MHDFKEDKLVGMVSEAIALTYGYSQPAARQFRFAASLHDIGKLKIPDAILNKPDKLTESEFTIMKTHTYHGSQILKSVQGDFGVMLRQICLYHHENWDGSGYWGIYQSDLPEYVPIVSLADTFVALLSERAYKPKWEFNDAVGYICEKAGSQFSPTLTGKFLALVNRDSTKILEGG